MKTEVKITRMFGVTYFLLNDVVIAQAAKYGASTPAACISPGRTLAETENEVKEQLSRELYKYGLSLEFTEQ